MQSIQVPIDCNSKYYDEPQIFLQKNEDINRIRDSLCSHIKSDVRGTKYKRIKAYHVMKRRMP